MRKAATMLIGEHDFAAFCNVKKNEEYAHHVRRMDFIEIVPLSRSPLYHQNARQSFFV